MKKISYLSTLLLFSCILYTFWIVFSFFYSWIILKYPIHSPLEFNVGASIQPQHNDVLLPNFFTMNAPFIWKVACTLEALIIFSFYLFFTSNAIRLFALYRKQVIFDLTCVRLIKNIGLFLLLINITHLICPAINTYILSHSISNAFKSLFFGTEQATLFIISLVLITTSWIMEEGYKLHDEQQHTV